MVLDPSALPPASELSDVSVRLLDPHAPSFADDVAVVRAVAEVGFGTPGTDSGEPGPAERDAAVVALDEAEATEERRKAVSKQRITALAETAGDGALASGVGMRTGDVVEIAGVATLPMARRKGLGAAVTAAIARRALDDGADVVFLAAGSEDIARVYVRVGFRRIGTACIAEPAPVPA
jgi:GNAT superfamily N-acetyltransferase